MAASAGIRQRGGSGGKTAAPAAAAAVAPEQQQQQQHHDELTTGDKINWYIAQYSGLVCCGAGIALLACGYDKEWMHNTHLCMLCLLMCLVGLFFHEFRPFNAQQIMEEQQKANSPAAS